MRRAYWQFWQRPGLERIGISLLGEGMLGPFPNISRRNSLRRTPQMPACQIPAYQA
jgi:hypothetical protein